MDGELHRPPLGFISTFICSWEFLVETALGIAPVKVPTKHWAMWFVTLPQWHLNPQRDICVWGGEEAFVFHLFFSKQAKKKKKKRNEKLLSLYITLPNTYFYSIIALPSCIFFFFFLNLFQKTLMWVFYFLFWKTILLSMESHSFNSSPVCSEIVSFIFGIRRKTILKSKFTPIKLNLIEKRQRHSLTS